MKLFRFGYILFSVILVGMLPNSTNAFGSAMLIFGLGLLYDYGQILIVKNCKRDIILGYIGLALSFLVVVIGVLCLMNCIYLTPYNSGVANVCIKNDPTKFTFFDFSVKYRGLSRSLGVFILLAAAELVFPVKRIHNSQSTQTA